MSPVVASRKASGGLSPLVGRAVLAAIVIAACALRLFRLDHQSVWYDEIFSLSVSRLPLAEMNRLLVRDLVHPPLHYYLLHYWFQLTGFGVFQARLLSAIFGILSVTAIYALAVYLYDRRTAKMCACLLATSQLTVMYSQEARPYAQFLFIFLICSYFFVRSLRDRGLVVCTFFLLTASLLTYTHYYGFFVLLAFALFLCVYRQRYSISRAWVLSGVILIGLAYVPWTASIVGEVLHGEKVRRTRSVSNLRPPAEHWYMPLKIVNTFNNGQPDGLLESSPWWTFLIGGILFTLPVIPAMVANVGERDTAVFLLLASTIPVGLALLAGRVGGFYSIRYVAFCAAPYYVLVARGISQIDRTGLRWVWLSLILAYAAFALRANYFVPYKEDYKGALAFIAEQAQREDCAVVAQPWEDRQARWAWSIYESPRIDPQILPLDSLSGSTDCRRVWLISVSYRGSAVAQRQADHVRAELKEGYTPSARRQFFWIDIDLFSRVGGR
jgi:uncharacterized membrane protein